MNYTDLERITFTGPILQSPTTEPGKTSETPQVVRTAHDYVSVVNVSTTDGIRQLIFVGLDALTVAENSPLSVGSIGAVSGRLTTVGELRAEWFEPQAVQSIEDIRTSLHALGLDDNTDVVRVEVFADRPATPAPINF
jgi:hypothetical protein